MAYKIGKVQNSITRDGCTNLKYDVLLLPTHLSAKLTRDRRYLEWVRIWSNESAHELQVGMHLYREFGKCLAIFTNVKMCIAYDPEMYS